MAKQSKKTLRVTAIIVHYENEIETHACLDSLAKIHTHGLEFAAVVIDNGSREPLELSGSQRKFVTLLRSDTNLGFTSGNNVAIQHALSAYEPDYILLINNDTLSSPDFLEKLVACAEEHPQAGVVTPLIYFAPGHEFHKGSYTAKEQGKVVWYAGGTIDWAHLDAFHRGVDELDRGQFTEVKQTDFATGCCMLLPAKVLEVVGGFDAQYFLYLEDVDLSVRIQQAGYQLLMCPQAKIWHVNAGSSGGAGSPIHVYYQTRNRLYFFFRYAALKWQWQKFLPTWSWWRKDLDTFLRQILVIRVAGKKLLFGERLEQHAVLDWIFNQMGKQALW